MKTAVLIDFDGTIFDRNGYVNLRDEYYKQKFDKKFWKRFKGYEHDYAIGKVKIFNLHDVLTDEELAITNQHIKKVVPNLLYKDFVTFMGGGVDTNHFTPIILTFGEPELQSTKIAAAGLDLPVIHTDIKNKTKLIECWYSQGFYEINDSKFEKVILIDDRADNFIGFGDLPNARGFLIQRKVEEKMIAKFPKNVSVISSFEQIIL